MNYYLFIPLTAFLANGFIIVYVFAQKKRDKAANAFLLYSIGLSLWIIYNFFIWLPLDPEINFLGMKYGSPVWISISFLMFRFVYILLHKKKDFFYRFSFYSVLLAIGLTIFTDRVIEDNGLEYWGYTIKGGPYYLPLIFTVMIPPVIYSLFLLLYNSFKTTSELLKKQYLLLLLGFAFIFFLSVITVILLPYLFKIKIPSMTSGSTVIQSFFTFYAIFRYRFLSLSVENVAEEIFSEVQDGVILLNKNFEIENMNHSAKTLLGIEDKVYFGSNICNLIPDCKPHTEYKNIESEINVNDEKKYLSLSHSFLKVSLKEFGSLLIVRDITEKKENESKIQKLYSTILEDLEFARLTQEALIADKFPESEYFQIQSLFSPVEKVGGDIINYKIKKDHSIDIFFADVSGHGVSAAMVASSATIAFNVSSEAGLSPSDGLFNIQKLLSPTITQHYISAIYMNYKPKTGEMTYSYAGHHPILHIDANFALEDLSGNGVLLLAITKPEYKNYHHTLRKGEKILLYSDGLFEIRNPTGQLFGRNNFLKIAKIASEKNSNFLDSLASYSINYGAGNQLDDMTLLMLARTK